MNARPLLLRYLARVPVGEPESIATLGEGETPLVPSRALGPRLGLHHLYFKLEQTNPTGSYKDRFAALLISLMRERGQTSCLATSSGNTGAALCAYAARYGLTCRLYINEQTPQGKITQILAYGQPVYRVKGFGASPAATERIFERLARRAEAEGAALGISAYRYAPDAMEGVKTIAYEIAAQLDRAPDRVFAPVGGGGLFTAIGRGFDDLTRTGECAGLPRLHPVQPEANDTVVSCLNRGEARARAVATVTAISGLAVPLNLDGDRVIQAARASGGRGHLVGDQDIWAAQGELCRGEGLYVEPAGAVAAAGLIRAHEEGHVGADDLIVCVLTGHGFKDPAAIERLCGTVELPLIDAADV